MSEVTDVTFHTLQHDLVKQEVTIRIDATIRFEQAEINLMVDNADTYRANCAIKASVAGPNPFLHSFADQFRFRRGNTNRVNPISFEATVPAADLDVGPGRDRIFANVYLHFELLELWDDDTQPKKGTSERRDGWFGDGPLG
jgi:hypothetical protein